MNSHTPRYCGYRLPPAIISHAVRLYHCFSLSFRDIDDLLAEQGITVSYEIIRQWCGKTGPVYASRVKQRQGQSGDTWHLDELFPESVAGSRVAIVVVGETEVFSGGSGTRG